MPVIPATQEAEAGELLEPRGGGCGDLRSRHCTPAWVTRVKLRLKKKIWINILILGMYWNQLVTLYQFGSNNCPVHEQLSYLVHLG